MPVSNGKGITAPIYLTTTYDQCYYHLKNEWEFSNSGLTLLDRVFPEEAAGPRSIPAYRLMEISRKDQGSL